MLEKPKLEAELLEMEDPTFEAGIVKVATARLTNLSAKAFTYATELYLGAAKVATSGVSSVAIPAGSYVDVSYSLVMPAVEGVYKVYLDVWYEATLLKHYEATEDVTIVISPLIDVGPIIWT